MKSISAMLVVFSILLVVNLSYARKDMGEYWKNVMNDQPMPEVVKDLIEDPQVSDAGKDHFIRDFDIKPNNATIFHTHVVPTSRSRRHLTRNLN
ncbi:organ-specific protein P4-like [Lotus japonicus]|uniref:organ-specific protein P4-like n=1 Tax=Lotus japonicus TaxID=34305 RepID=UPI0025857DAC|nr:organ-specific protein P4-like [Lotus japonicus]